MTSRLKIVYDNEIVSKLLGKLSLKNRHEAPRITKVILNMGLGEDAADGKKLKNRLEKPLDWNPSVLTPSCSATSSHACS